jgi:hypothetical protein
MTLGAAETHGYRPARLNAAVSLLSNMLSADVQCPKFRVKTWQAAKISMFEFSSVYKKIL